jgi:hypothetical protein
LGGPDAAREGGLRTHNGVGHSAAGRTSAGAEQGLGIVVVLDELDELVDLKCREQTVDISVIAEPMRGSQDPPTPSTPPL